jgi:hypothetical protein
VRSGVRDRVGGDAERIRFSSAILPPYARRSKSLECWSRSSASRASPPATSEEALIALLKDAGGLSAHNRRTAQGGLVAGACALEQRRSLQCPAPIAPHQSRTLKASHTAGRA